MCNNHDGLFEGLHKASLKVVYNEYSLGHFVPSSGILGTVHILSSSQVHLLQRIRWWIGQKSKENSHQFQDIPRPEIHGNKCDRIHELKAASCAAIDAELEAYAFNRVGLTRPGKTINSLNLRTFIQGGDKKGFRDSPPCTSTTSCLLRHLPAKPNV
jgi:hypothetical protein